MNPILDSSNCVFLTKYDLECLDPTGKGGAKIRSYHQTDPTPSPRILQDSAESYFAHFQELRAAVLKNHPIVKEWDEEWDRKCGPQGGNFPFSDLEKQYDASYELAQRTIALSNLWIGRDYLLRLIGQTIERVGYPQMDLDGLWRGTDDTFAGLPTCGRKGSYLAETYVPGLGWRHVVPNLPGQRYQRLKKRSINMSATSNVRYMEKILSAVRNWLRTYLPEFFGGWINPAMEVAPTITQAVRRNWWSVETDFDGCDQHFGLDLISEAIFPIYELLLPKMEFMRFAAFIEECYYEPVFCGSYCRIGKHNSFSGEAHVSDFETMYDVMLGLTAAFEAGATYGQYHIVAIGDDLTVLVKGSERLARRVFDTAASVADANGMALSIPKCSVTRGNARFAKRLYVPGLPVMYNALGAEYIIGAYPSSLTINTIIWPEYHAASRAEEILATVQRFDNLYGSPMWAPAVQDFFSRAVDKADRKLLLDFPANATLWDWWARLYGEAWYLGDSPTYRHLLRSKLV